METVRIHDLAGGSCGIAFHLPKTPDRGVDGLVVGIEQSSHRLRKVASRSTCDLGVAASGEEGEDKEQRSEKSIRRVHGGMVSIEC